MSLRIIANDPKQQKLRSDLERKYASYLHNIIDDIFEVATNEKDWTWSKLSYMAGLSYSTVLKLGNRQTRYPRHMSVWKLAKAVGLRYEVKELTTPVLRQKAG
jgi:hypothetical protein